MTQTVYINGAYLPADAAKISVFDRGFLFADAIYDVAAVLNGKLVDANRHLDRLQRSMASLTIPSAIATEDVLAVMRRLVALDQISEGLVYIQVSRGPAKRDFLMPKDPSPTVVLFVTAKSIIHDPKVEVGLRVMSTPDLRWKRGDIKTVALLAASMAKTAAVQAGYDDAWMVLDGCVTEGSSNNAFIVLEGGRLVTRGLGSEILPGITRRVVLDIADQDGLTIEERPFTVEEAQQAQEAFITSASSFVYPVVEIDDVPLGSGKPGPITQKIRQRYIDIARAEAI